MAAPGPEPGECAIGIRRAANKRQAHVSVRGVQVQRRKGFAQREDHPLQATLMPLAAVPRWGTGCDGSVRLPDCDRWTMQGKTEPLSPARGSSATLDLS